MILLSTTAALCAATTYAGQRLQPVTSAASAATRATRWQPWRAADDTRCSPPAQIELQADLVRHVEMRMKPAPVFRRRSLSRATCSAGGPSGPPSSPESLVTSFLIIVYERHGGGWREAARHELGYLTHLGPVTPVRIDRAHAWVIAEGTSGARAVPTWAVLRFDGANLRAELHGGWFDIMLVDVDLDGALEILGEDISHVNCYYCGLSSRSVGVYRWNGAEIAEVSLETLPAGAASDAAVAANNRAAELAGAGRWAEALAVVDGARALVAESAVFRRNASLIDVNAAAAGRDRLSGDRLLHYVFGGLWADAVDIFRHEPVVPDFFATPPPYMDDYMLDGDSFVPPPFLRAVFDATAAARGVAPARAEIEFLHGWSAYHLHDWSAYLARLDRSDPSTDSRLWSPGWYGFRDPGASVALEALERAAALAPNDPLFAEARRLVADRADLAHADAMRRTFLLFDTGGEPCAEPLCVEARRRPDGSADIGATAWRPWPAPSDTGRPLAEAPDGADLIRRFAAVYRRDGETLEQVRAFPLAGGRFDGRTFWAVFDPSADTCRAHDLGVSIHFASECTAPVLAVYERGDGGWRAVAQRHVPLDVVSIVAPVAIEPSQAWIVVRGGHDWNAGANESEWEILRFDGEFLHVEGGDWRDAMIADVDLDGALEILGRDDSPLCYQCPVTRRVVRLYRWNGTRLAAVPLEVLPAGAASEAAVAANNRAVELARARRWMEAAAVLDEARALVGENAVFRRNASLIDAVDGGRLSEDALLHHVFAGSWADAAALFRDTPVGPDLFAEPLPYVDESARSESRYGTPPFMRAVFDATAAARAVAPALPEIEFLHAWSAFHLDPDTTPASSTARGDLEYRIDVDEAALLEVFDRAASLAPGDPLFAEARRVAADRSAP